MEWRGVGGSRREGGLATFADCSPAKMRKESDNKMNTLSQVQVFTKIIVCCQIDKTFTKE